MDVEVGGEFSGRVWRVAWWEEDADFEMWTDGIVLDEGRLIGVADIV